MNSFLTFEELVRRTNVDQKTKDALIHMLYDVFSGSTVEQAKQKAELLFELDLTAFHALFYEERACLRAYEKSQASCAEVAAKTTEGLEFFDGMKAYDRKVMQSLRDKWVAAL